MMFILGSLESASGLPISVNDSTHISCRPFFRGGGEMLRDGFTPNFERTEQSSATPQIVLDLTYLALSKRGRLQEESGQRSRPTFGFISRLISTSGFISPRRMSRGRGSRRKGMTLTRLFQSAPFP